MVKEARSQYYPQVSFGPQATVGQPSANVGSSNSNNNSSTGTSGSTGTGAGSTSTTIWRVPLRIAFRVIGQWLERPYLFVFPAIGVIAAVVLAAQCPTAPGRCRSTWSR